MIRVMSCFVFLRTAVWPSLPTSRSSFQHRRETLRSDPEKFFGGLLKYARDNLNEEQVRRLQTVCTMRSNVYTIIIPGT